MLVGEEFFQSWSRRSRLMSSYRSGFVAFVGRPNVGKSTLTNAIVGSKVAITSSKPQTTRRAIRGIRTEQSGQLIVVDTPGFHKPKTLLGKRLNSVVEETLTEVDVICFCTPANEALGPGDQMIVDEISKFKRTKKIAIVTKQELASKEQVARHLLQVSQLTEWDEIIPVSAVTGEQIERLIELLISHLPEGPALYPADAVDEQSVEDITCELIREAALEKLREELPHSLAVTVDEISEDGKKIFASLWVERDSQKGILIGKGGQQLKAIGSDARREIEERLGEKIFLSLQVKVASNWQQDPKKLGKLGF
jgi:GTP-binding protein Era